MGKPAARMGDLTAHGGTIVVGMPTILIGKMPAAAMGDMHVCPMLTGPVPHVGGPITLGSTGVLIGKKPAARISDVTVCVGPPSMPVMGCFTVLIGEVGSGSQAGSAGAASAAQAAKKKGPKAIKAFPLAEPPPATEAHFIRCEFTDSAGRPLSGVPYRITDPDKREIVGVTTCDGMAYHDGYAKSGSFDVFIPELKNAKWGSPKLKLGEVAKFSVDADLPADATEAHVAIVLSSGNLRKTVAYKVLPVQGKRIKGEWTPDWADLAPAEAPPGGETGGPDIAAPSECFFVVCSGGMVCVSDPAPLVGGAEAELLDPEGKPMADADYEITDSGGRLHSGKLDGKGCAKVEEAALGPFKVKFPGQSLVMAVGRPGNSSSPGGLAGLTGRKNRFSVPPDKLQVRLGMPPEDADTSDDRFILESTDFPRTVEKVLTVKDDANPGDAFLELLYEDLDPTLSYTLRWDKGRDGEGSVIFENVPFVDLNALSPVVDPQPVEAGGGEAEGGAAETGETDEGLPAAQSIRNEISYSPRPGDPQPAAETVAEEADQAEEPQPPPRLPEGVVSSPFDGED